MSNNTVTFAADIETTVGEDAPAPPPPMPGTRARVAAARQPPDTPPEAGTDDTPPEASTDATPPTPTTTTAPAPTATTGGGNDDDGSVQITGVTPPTATLTGWPAALKAAATTQKELDGPSSGPILHHLRDSFQADKPIADIGLRAAETTTVHDQLYGLLTQAPDTPNLIHAITFKRASPFLQDGADAFWGLQGAKDFAYTVAIRGDLTKTEYRVPTAATLAATTDAAGFLAVPTPNSGPKHPMLPICPVPACVLLDLYTGPDAYGHGAVGARVAAWIRNHDTDANGHYYQDALGYILQWLWAAAKGKVKPVGLQHLRTAASATYEKNTHARFLPQAVPTATPAPAAALSRTTAAAGLAAHSWGGTGPSTPSRSPPAPGSLYSPRTMQVATDIATAAVRVHQAATWPHPTGPPPTAPATDEASTTKTSKWTKY